MNNQITYTPYGEAWEAEMLRLSKKHLINMVKNAGIAAQEARINHGYQAMTNGSLYSHFFSNPEDALAFAEIEKRGYSDLLGFGINSGLDFYGKYHTYELYVSSLGTEAVSHYGKKGGSDEK